MPRILEVHAKKAWPSFRPVFSSAYDIGPLTNKYQGAQRQLQYFQTIRGSVASLGDVHICARLHIVWQRLDVHVEPLLDLVQDCGVLL